MVENVQQWWARRQWSRGAEVPYPVGSYREAWARYPVLIRQYHPEFNHGITLTQIPPAAEVLLLWQCDAGHLFVATPEEQRRRPGGSRRRSTWCPECSVLAKRRTPPGLMIGEPEPSEGEEAATGPAPYSCGHPFDPRRVVAKGDTDDRCALCIRLDGAPVTRAELHELVAPSARSRFSDETRLDANYSWSCPVGHGSFEASVRKVVQGRRCPVCRHARAGADAVAVGEAFVSPWAPPPASAAEAQLRSRLLERLDVDVGCTAVRVARPFFAHIEVWPDLVLPELRVAIEYDTVGRGGLEHVGRREEVDRRKDRLLRAVGWEVIRIRIGALQPLGPHDLVAPGISGALVDRLVDRLCAIRGELLVAAYRREGASA